MMHPRILLASLLVALSCGMQFRVVPRSSKTACGRCTTLFRPKKGHTGRFICTNCTGKDNLICDDCKGEIEFGKAKYYYRYHCVTKHAKGEHVVTGWERVPNKSGGYCWYNTATKKACWESEISDIIKASKWRKCCINKRVFVHKSNYTCMANKNRLSQPPPVKPSSPAPPATNSVRAAAEKPAAPPAKSPQRHEKISDSNPAAVSKSKSSPTQEAPLKDVAGSQKAKFLDSSRPSPMTMDTKFTWIYNAEIQKLKKRSRVNWLQLLQYEDSQYAPLHRKQCQGKVVSEEALGDAYDLVWHKYETLI